MTAPKFVVAVEVPPLHGPPCRSPEAHTWTLTVSEGSVLLGSGCDDCDSLVDEVEMAGEIRGRVRWVNGCDNPGGWHGFHLCDHGGWWVFEPAEIVPEGASDAP